MSAKDVAAKAGVSRAAVSRTFTPGASVSPETRSKVLEAAEALGYEVNHLARGLIRQQSGIVALVVAQLATPYRSELVRALTDQLQAAGKVAILINTDRSDSTVDMALQQAIRYRADAAIVLSGMPERSITELCHRNGLRLVLINRDDSHTSSIQIRLNDAEAARLGLIAFVRSGCKKLALATSEAGTPSLVAREQSFLAEAGKRGIDVICERYGPTGYESGLVLGERLLVRPDRPDAVFCTTDLLACGVMDAARHRFSLAIPDDLSIIGFDNIPQAGWEAYQLTTFTQPVEDIAAAAMDWLSHTETQEKPHVVHLTATMAWRKSVRSGKP
ncbi:LacI family DNA-binding transcriptional regulator [Nitratireductor thuwali]|uniref:Catabolite control protein A n=1 Tax=Nitratireductor thuwali TaxID=2267699 RepID=A0ABY5MLF3_9HYPH|nr:Catabolite control protein A [Nitratireductor thuwali]